MALRVALEIAGDNAGARKAVAEVGTDVENLAKKADAAADPLRQVAESLGQAADKAPAAAAPLQDVGTALGTAATAAPEAAAGIARVGTDAEAAGGKMGGFRSALLGAAGVFVGSFSGAVLGAAVSGATDALFGFFRAITDSTPRIEADLKSHKELVDRIKGAYGEAQGAASSYGNASAAFLRFKEQQNLVRLGGDFAGEQRNLLDGGFWRSNALQPGMGPADSPFTEAIVKLRTELAAGKADVIGFRQEVSRIASELPVDDRNRTFAEAILGDTEQAAKLQEELSRSVDLLKGLAGNADAAATALGGSSAKYTEVGSAAAAQLPALREFDALLKSIGTGSAGAVAVPATTAAALPAGVGGGWASGGYTGDGPRLAPAGVVHRGEFVINATATTRNRALLEAINSGLPGYAAGGLVGSASVATDTSPRPFGEQLDILASAFGSLRGATGALIAEIGTARDPLRQLGAVAESAGQRLLSFAAGIASQLAGKFFNAAGNSIISAIFPGFSGGGYTGDGPRLAPAGVVHREEFVVNAAATARHRPLLEAINRGVPGFAAGGFVGRGSEGSPAGLVFAPQTTIHAQGSNLGEAQIQALLDERDRAIFDQLPEAVRYLAANPRRTRLPR